MVDLDISVIFAGLSIAASILYYASVLRNQNKTQQMQLETRQAQLFMFIYDRWSSPEYTRHFYALQEWEWADYEDFLEKYGGRKNPDVYIHFNQMASFLEGIGVLVKRELVDPILVDDLISYVVITFWEKFGSIIMERRVRDNTPQAFEWVEFLYSVIQPIALSQHPELKT
jgi:hypothetical protein